MQPDNDNLPMLITLKEAAKRTSLSRTMINRYRAEGRFPSPIPLGDRRIAFIGSEVAGWIQSRIDDARVAGRAAA